MEIALCILGGNNFNHFKTNLNLNNDSNNVVNFFCSTKVKNNNKKFKLF